MNHRINARGMEYRQLNEMIRGLIKEARSKGDKKAKIILENVLGQRYIGDGLDGDDVITIYGVPGNDLAAFMDGPTVEVHGNAQDGIGNTMNAGRVIVHGDSGDIAGYSMRGGEIYIRGNTGYRCGIHMKSYLEKIPVIVIGGSTGNFLGEYMAGGIIILLGLHNRQPGFFPGGQIRQNGQVRQAAGSFIGTGMHGGTIYVRGDIEEHKLGKEVKKVKPGREDIDILS
ncbi:MAG: hypothetical protein JW770_03190, partial [Actinobacteria bacterium]|nr:hypothetical protein [Actinomycetota bacterium]